MRGRLADVIGTLVLIKLCDKLARAENDKAGTGW